MEQKICPKCGNELESDNFCLKCLEFARISDEERVIFNQNLMYNENEEVDDYYETFDNSIEEDKDKKYIIEENKKASFTGYLTAFAVMVSIIIFGIVGLVAVKKGGQGDSVVVSNSSKELSEANILSTYDTSSTILTDAKEELDYEENSESSLEDYEIKYPDYEEIMAAKEPSTYFQLYDIMTSDIVSQLNDYIYSIEDCEISYDDQQMNNFVISYNDGTEYSCYESYNSWSYKDNSDDEFYLVRDTVTGNLLSIGIRSKNFDRASKMMVKSLEIVENQLTKVDKLNFIEQLDRSHKDIESNFQFKNQIVYGEEKDGFIRFDMYLNSY